MRLYYQALRLHRSFRGLVTETQTLNPYPCGLNNPLAHPDPSGLFPDNVGDPSAPPSGGDSYLNDRANKLPDTGGACPLPPGMLLPPDADVTANVQEAEERVVPLTDDLEGPYFRDPISGDLWFVNKVRPKGDWDYKKLTEDERYADFGNFNFGATGHALRYDLWELKLGGGLVEVAVNAFDPRYALFEYGYPFLPPNFGESDQDVKFVTLGFDFYTCVWNTRTGR